MTRLPFLQYLAGQLSHLEGGVIAIVAQAHLEGIEQQWWAALETAEKE